MNLKIKLVFAFLLFSQSFALTNLKDEVTELSKDSKTDLFQEAIDEHHQLIAEQMDAAYLKNQEQLQQLVGATKYVCTGGKKPSSLSRRDYIKAFNKGPCAPTVFLAGISGTKLMVTIDCEKFKANHPDDFSKCWSTCTGSGAPQSEYRIWVPQIGSPMSILSPSSNKKACFTSLIGWDTKKLAATGETEYRAGIKVYPMGLSPGTKTKASSDCGMDSITNLVPTKIQVSGFSQYRDNVKAFVNAGYKTGINLQALPYDWRLSYKNAALNENFKKVIKRLWENTGKKVVIVAHSFGNMQVAHNLWNMSQTDKDKYIARYIALAPPYLGSPILTAGLIGYADNYVVNLYITSLGVTPKMFKDGFTGSRGIYNLMPKNTCEVNKDKPWMKAFFDRIQAEKYNRKQASGTVMDIFPQPTETCNSGFKSRDKKCKFDLFDMSRLGSVNGEEVDSYNMEDILTKYGVGYQEKKFWRENYDERWETLPNLGVQTNIVFSTTVQSKKFFTFKSDPRSQTSQFKIVNPDWVLGYGDGSVLASSAIIPGIKWADDFNNKVSGAKPVNFIEMCSDYNRRTTVFEGTSKRVTKNSYFGISCGCKGTSLFPSDGSNCDHVKLVSDAKTIELMLNSAIDYQVAENTSTRKAFESMTDYSLKSYEENCKLLTE